MSKQMACSTHCVCITQSISLASQPFVSIGPKYLSVSMTSVALAWQVKAYFTIRSCDELAVNTLSIWLQVCCIRSLSAIVL